MGHVAKTIIARINRALNIQSAIALPPLVNRSGTYDLEERTGVTELTGPFLALGYEVSFRALTSGLQAVVTAEDGLQGGADPRREGLALGNLSQASAVSLWAQTTRWVRQSWTWALPQAVLGR